MMDQQRYLSLRASLEEFVAICVAGGTASLTLTTSGGVTNRDLNSATTGICIASYFSHANVFCQTYSHSIHFGAETSHSLSTLQQYILVSL